MALALEVPLSGGALAWQCEVLGGCDPQQHRNTVQCDSATNSPRTPYPEDGTFGDRRVKMSASSALLSDATLWELGPPHCPHWENPAGWAQDRSLAATFGPLLWGGPCPQVSAERGKSPRSVLTLTSDPSTLTARPQSHEVSFAAWKELKPVFGNQILTCLLKEEFTKFPIRNKFVWHNFGGL